MKYETLEFKVRLAHTSVDISHILGGQCESRSMCLEKKRKKWPLVKGPLFFEALLYEMGMFVA